MSAIPLLARAARLTGSKPYKACHRSHSLLVQVVTQPSVLLLLLLLLLLLSP